MQGILKKILTLAVVTAVAAGGFFFFKNRKPAKKEEVTYEFGKVERRDVRSFVTATGVIEPWKIVDIKSNVGGRIDRLTVELGDRVTKGQLIMEIDPTDPRAESEQSAADLAAALARKDQSLFTREQQEKQTAARIAGAGKSLLVARARLAEAEAQMRTQPLITKSAIAQASASLASAEKSVLQARQNKDQLNEQLAQLKDVTIPLNTETVTSNLAQARAGLVTANAEFVRQRNLAGQGFAPRAEVEAAHSRLATARASLRTAEQRERTLLRENDLAIREMNLRIAEAQSRIEEAEARVQQSRASLEIARQNQIQDEIRRHEHTAAQAAVEQSEAELETARAEERQVQVRHREVTAARAQVVKGEAALRKARTNLTYTTISAPRDGVVIARNVEEGTVVPSSRGSIGGTNALLQIGDTSRLWIKCNVDETDIGQVMLEQKVTIRVDAYPSMLIDGKVIRIDPQAIVVQNVTMIPVTVEILEPDDRFKPGMNATCEFIVDEALGVLAVANEALKESEGEYKVQKLVSGKPADVVVEVGIAGPDVTEIRSGLEDGEEVITRIIEPERPQTRNPFGSPFGSFGSRGSSGSGGRGGGGPGGGSGGGGGGRGGGGR